MNSWDLSDAWILAAVYNSRGQENPDLSYVVEAADGLNHALPTRMEIQQALTRLCAAGVIKVEDAAIRVASGNEASLRACVDRARDHFDIVGRVHEWLRNDVALPEVVDAEMLSEAEFEQAERDLRTRRKQRRKT